MKPYVPFKAWRIELWPRQLPINWCTGILGGLILHVRSLANGDTDPGDYHREDQIQITTEILPTS